MRSRETLTRPKRKVVTVVEKAPDTIAAMKDRFRGQTFAEMVEWYRATPLGTALFFQTQMMPTIGLADEGSRNWLESWGKRISDRSILSRPAVEVIDEIVLEADERLRARKGWPTVTEDERRQVVQCVFSSAFTRQLWNAAGGDTHQKSGCLGLLLVVATGIAHWPTF